MPPRGEQRLKRVHYNSQITSWANIGGAADLGAAMRDDVTTTYARGPTTSQPNFGHHLRIRIGSSGSDNISLAAGERVVAMRARAKVRGLGGTSVHTRLWLQLRRGANYHGLKANYKSYLSSTAFMFNGDWFTHDADGRDLSVVANTPGGPLVVDDTMIWLIDDTSQSIGTGSRVAVEELYFDYIVNRQPAVSNLAIDSSTTTTRPTASWDWSDADGDGQSEFELAVFTAEQYGAAGFDPSKTGALERNKVQGAAQSFQVISQLQDGKAYRIYVRAAHPLQEFGPYWSDWAFVGFTMALTPPVPPTISAGTLDVSQDRHSINIQGRVNTLLENDASFEVNVGTWVPNANVTTMARSTTAPFHGIAAGRATFTGAGAASVKTGAYAALAGKTYGFGGRSRANATARTFTLELRFYSDAGGTTQIGSFSTAGVVETVGAYTTFQASSGLAPAGTQSYRLFALWNNGAASEVHDIDALTVAPGGTPPAFMPGGLEGGGLTKYEAQYADFNRRGNIVPAQISSGGEVEGTAEGFYPRTAGDAIGVTNEVLPYHGGSCIRWVPSAAGSVLDIGTREGATSLEPYVWSAAPGVGFEHEIRVRLYSGSTNLKLRVSYLDGAGAHLLDVDSPSTLVGTSWTALVPPDSTAPSGTVYVKAEIQNTGGLTGFPYFVDAFVMGETPVDFTKLGSGQGQPASWLPHRQSLNRDTGETDVILLANDFVAAQEAVIPDFEVPPDKVRVYRVRAVSQVAGVEVGSVWSNLVAVTAPTTQWWVKDPFRPWLNLRVLANTKPLVRSRGIRKGVHEVMGSEYPVVIGSKTRRERFSFDVTLVGRDDLLKADGMLSEGGVLFIKGPDRAWYAHIISDPTSAFWPNTFTDSEMTSVPLDFLEVGPP